MFEGTQGLPYSSSSLCFFGCRMVVLVGNDDEVGVIEIELAARVDEIC